jgi:hypothetical protein
MNIRYFERLNGEDLAPAPDYSTLVVIGAILSLALLSGCVSPSQVGATDTELCNTATRYPVVGR